MWCLTAADDVWNFCSVGLFRGAIECLVITSHFFRLRIDVTAKLEADWTGLGCRKNIHNTAGHSQVVNQSCSTL